MKPFA